MRRLYTLLLLFLVGSAGLYAQFTEDFESGIPNNWAIFDNGTGTGQAWVTSFTNCGGTRSAFVRYENVSSGTAVDYLVTPLITIDAGSPVLSYDTRESFASNFGSQYSIRVSTTSQTDAASFITIYTYGETTNSSTTCRTESVDLSAYAGQDIYIAFVMENDNGDSFFLDNVSIDGVSNACTNPAATYAVVDDCGGTGTFNVEVTITNLGGATTLTIADNQGSADQTAIAVNDVLSFGPYAQGTSIVFTTTNADDGGCSTTSPTQTFTCPPANDDCANAEMLVCNAAAISGTTVGATDNADGLGCTQGRAVWYSFVGNGLPVTLTATEINNFDIELAVATGTCAGGFTNVDCEDTTGDEVITFTTTDGETYYVTVGHFSNTNISSGTFTIELSCETCLDPTVTYSIVDDCAANTEFNVMVNVSDLGSATSVTVTDDQNNTGQTTMVAGVLTFGPYVSGTDVVFTTTNDQDGTCSVTSPVQSFNCPPANDACAGAIALTVTTDGTCSAPLTTTNAASTASGETPNPSCGSFGGGQDVWYTAEVPASGTLTIEVGVVSGGPSDMVMQAYTGTCGNLVLLECDDDDGPISLEPLLELTDLTPGDIITLRLFESGNNSFGDFTICAHTVFCTEATATYSVISDCGNGDNFLVQVDITDFGSATVITASNDADASTFTLDATTPSGTFGPFANGTGVVVTLTPEDPACAVTSGTLTQNGCPPANDACESAIALTDASGMPTAASGMTYDSRTTDPASSVAAGACGSFTGNSDDDIWFTVTAPNGTGDVITVIADDLPTASSDLVVILYSGDCNNLVQVACADSGNPETIIYTVPATRGGVQDASAAPMTFLVQVFTYESGGGRFTVNAAVALPVELTSFTGTAMEKANKLEWVTAREEAADRYLVERTTNGSTNWSTIGEVLAAGDSETELAYELMDEQPLPSAVYRLKMLDLDGSFTYSNLVRLDNATLVAEKLGVFPNPTSGYLTVNFTARASGQAGLSVTDLNGRVVSQRTVGVTAGLENHSVDLSTAPAGVYLLRVNVDGEQLVRRVIRR